MRLLVLGGTRFVGRAVVDTALARGHELTLFNRSAVGDSAGRYLFVSTVSVYANQSIPPVEGAAVAQLSDPEDRAPVLRSAKSGV